VLAVDLGTGILVTLAVLKEHDTVALIGHPTSSCDGVGTPTEQAIGRLKGRVRAIRGCKTVAGLEIALVLTRRDSAEGAIGGREGDGWQPSLARTESRSPSV
jgi:hypothetical protein